MKRSPKNGNTDNDSSLSLPRKKKTLDGTAEWIDLEVRIDKEVYDNLSSTRKKVWIAERKTWKFTNNNGAQCVYPIIEKEGVLQSLAMEVDDEKKSLIVQLTQDVMNNLTYSKQTWKETGDVTHYTKTQQYMNKCFKDNMFNSSGRNAMCFLLNELVTDDKILPFNIGGCRTANNLLGHFNVHFTVIERGKGTSDSSQKSEDQVIVEEDPQQYTPVVDVILCRLEPKSRRVYINVSVKSECIEKLDKEQINVEMLSLLPTNGPGTIVGLLISSTDAHISLAEKNDNQITLTRSQTEYNFVKRKSDLYKCIYDMYCLYLKAKQVG